MAGDRVNIEAPVARVPSHMPPDTIAVSTYAEALEVLRSPKFRPEPTTENAPISDGVLTFSYGDEHIRRRRIMNRLVRAPALEQYREQLIVPALADSLRELYEHPDPDGVHRADLVEFTMLPFVRFAGALAGFDVSQPGRVKELLQLIMDMSALNRVRWSTEDHRPYIERGIQAKDRFKDAYFDPALAACPYQPGSEVSRDQHDLVSLMAAELDPAWHDDPDLKVRDTAISLFAAGVGSSAEMMTNVVEELSGWLRVHPQDEARLEDSRFVSAVVQESLRLHPTPPGTGRVALEDVMLSSGHLVKAGQWVAVLLTHANRDPSVFGEDAGAFNPDRELPAGVPHYATSFGAGSHQCLGLPVVLGKDGVGSHVHVVRILLAAGVRRDPDREPIPEQSERPRWERYPVVFTTLEKAISELEGVRQ